MPGLSQDPSLGFDEFLPEEVREEEERTDWEDVEEGEVEEVVERMEEEEAAVNLIEEDKDEDLSRLADILRLLKVDPAQVFSLNISLLHPNFLLPSSSLPPYLPPSSLSSFLPSSLPLLPYFPSLLPPNPKPPSLSLNNSRTLHLKNH